MWFQYRYLDLFVKKHEYGALPCYVHFPLIWAPYLILLY